MASVKKEKTIEWKMAAPLRLLSDCTPDERAQLLAAVSGLYTKREPS